MIEVEKATGRTQSRKEVQRSTRHLFRGVHTNTWFLWIVVLFAPFVHAQSIVGRVSDSTGAVVPKARITVRNQATNVELHTVTTGSGDYTVPYLKPGTYNVSATAQGFETQSQINILVQTSQNVTINFSLKLGSVVETVDVSGVQLDKGKADLGELVENERVNELPLNGGDLGQLAQLSAGTYYSGDIKYVRPFDNTYAALSINGGGYANNSLMLDGVSNEAAHGDAYNGTNSQVGYIAPVQSVQEFKVVTNPFDAQYGRLQGGAIDMTLKTGTNQLHGSIYEFARRGYLDANNWANNWNHTPKPGHTRDQYGFQLDGPVVLPKFFNGHDRTFFVTQFENWHETFPGNVTDTVPDPAWLNGDFSNLTWLNPATHANEQIKIYDPLTLHDDGTGKLIRDQFPGNKIPAARISAMAKAILSAYPAPNRPSNATQNSYTQNYFAQTPTTDVYRNALAKIDQVIGPNDRLSLRYGYWERSEMLNQNGIPGVGANGEFPHGERIHTFSPDWIHTFTPNLISDFRAAVIVRGNILNGGPLGYDLSTLGVPDSFISALGTFGHSLPYTNPSEFTAIGNNGGEFTVGNSLAMLPSVTYVLGKHTIHAGFDWRILQSSWRNIRGGTTFNVDRTWTQADYQNGDNGSGNSVASFLLGTASSGSVQINALAFYSQHYYAPFIQDDWKLLPNLTVSIGVRYDLNGAVLERHNRMDYIFNTDVVNPIGYQVTSPYLAGPLKGGLEFVGVNGNPRHFNDVTKDNWQPRLGVSWAVDSKTVVHGGFGLFYKNPNPGPNQLGFSATTQYVASNDGNKTPTQNLGVGSIAANPFPMVNQPAGSSQGYLTGLGQGLFFLNSKFKTPRTYQYTFGIQRQFFKDDIVELNYVGTRTTRLDTSDNINRPATAAYAHCNPQLGGRLESCNSDSGAYVTNPFQNVAAFQGTGYYSAATIQALNFTRPFPAFSDVTEYDINGGKTWYNALQLTASHRVSKALTVHGTWAWSKQMDEGGWSDNIYRIRARYIDSNDFAHRITFSGFYLLPFGRGGQLFNHVNRLVDEMIGGWEMSSIVSWQTGFPWELNGSTNYYGGARVDHTATSTSIRGVSNACVGQWQRQSDGSYALVSRGSSSDCSGNYNFEIIPGYGYRLNNVYTGIRNPGTENWDASLAKNFEIYERLKFQFRFDMFNALNHPTFSGNYNNSPLDANFGTIYKPAGQTNQPRNVQLTFKASW